MATEEAARNHHELHAHEVVLLLETHADLGLTTTEAAARLHRFGPNTLPKIRRHGAVVRFVLQVHNPLLYVLLVAGAVTALVGEIVDAAVIFGVVLINATVGFVQESRAERALEALAAMVETHATVIRDGRKLRVPSSNVVPGDVVVLEAGDKVPADLRLLDVTELQIDESLLTGESFPVHKDRLALPSETGVADRLNMAYSGTLAVGGEGRGIAVATGAGTEIGLIHRLMSEAGTVQTPLTRKIARFSRVLTVAVVVLAVFAFVVGLVRGEPAADMLTAAVALAVGAIPEGLPPVITITLAIGVTRMAARRAVIRKLPAVETLGSVTLIFSDKTGTLTENQMTVQTVIAGGEEFEVSGSGYAPDGTFARESRPVDPLAEPALRECLLAGALCNDARLVRRDDDWSIVGDPTEAALVVAARKAGIDEDVLSAFPQVDEIPFTSARQYMATMHESSGRGPRVIYVKGGVERVVAMCDGGRDFDAASMLSAAERLGDRGLRVLAFAKAERPRDSSLGAEIDGSLTFLGLQAMMDPPRAATPASVEACTTAGIAVKMITGDHPATARAVAARIGLSAGEPRVMTGARVAECPDADLPDAITSTEVFARVSPEQKLRLVEAVQRRGDVVAMTGDGVNDAPALKRADVGVAMGRAGTEVAKEAADIVLTDDNFESIEAAVEEGRVIFDNLTKFIAWVLPTSLGEGLVILAAILAGTALPILPVQILWINMTTAVALGLTLAFEPGEGGVMRRPPREPGRAILTLDLVGRIVLVSAVMVVGAFGLFHWEQSRGLSVVEARTVAVNVFVFVEITYLFNCRSFERSGLQLGILRNRVMIAGVLGMMALQAAFTYAPFMQRLFHTGAIDVRAWASVAAVSVAGYALVEAEKWLRRRTGRGYGSAQTVGHDA